jgi:hypothetical protein
MAGMSSDPEIGVLAAELERLRPSLDASKKEFLGNLERVLGEMLMEMAEASVTSNPAQARELGTQRLGELKSRVDAHVANAPDLVKQLFDRRELWPHEKEMDWSKWSRDQWFNPTGQMRLPSELANRMREAVRSLDIILRDFSLAAPASMPPISAALTRAIESYNESLDRYSVVARQLQAAESRKEQEEVRDMWRKA